MAYVLGNSDRGAGRKSRSRVSSEEKEEALCDIDTREGSHTSQGGGQGDTIIGGKAGGGGVY